MEEITIKDIARICGVGVSTVSRAINNHPDINPETKEMIMRVIKENNYVPNNSARNLKRQDAKAIAVLVKGINNSFFSQMIKVLEEEIKEKSYAMVLQHVDYDEDEVEVALKLVKEKRLRGIIFLGGYLVHSEEKLAQLHVPFILSTTGMLPKGFSRNTYSDLVISASNMVCNIDLAPVMRQHTETDADVTLVTKRIVSALDQSGDDVGIQGGEGNRVVGLSDNNNQGFDRVYLDMMIIRGSLLTRAIRDSLTTRSYDLIDVIARYIGELKVYFFDYPGYFRKINSIQSYYTASMDMLNPVITSRLFNPERWISTKMKDNPPTRYTKNAQVVNSLVASGCTVEGYLNSSVIFRHNSIGTGTTVNGSIIMEDCSIGRNVILENVILDRMVTISDDVVLQGTPENPVVLGKGVKI